MPKVILGLLLLLSAAALTAGAQEEASTAFIEVGVSVGLMWIPETGSLMAVGGAMGFSLAPSLSFRASYWHAGISLLGVSLLTVDAFDAMLLLDLFPNERAGFYIGGGAELVLAGALGEGMGELSALAALGLRVTPTDILKVYLEYRPLIRYGVLHTIHGGISVVF